LSGKKSVLSVDSFKRTTRGRIGGKGIIISWGLRVTEREKKLIEEVSPLLDLQVISGKGPKEHIRGHQGKIVRKKERGGVIELHSRGGRQKANWGS